MSTWNNAWHGKHSVCVCVGSLFSLGKVIPLFISIALDLRSPGVTGLPAPLTGQLGLVNCYRRASQRCPLYFSTVLEMEPCTSTLYYRAPSLPQTMTFQIKYSIESPKVADIFLLIL